MKNRIKKIELNSPSTFAKGSICTHVHINSTQYAWHEGARFIKHKHGKFISNLKLFSIQYDPSLDEYLKI